MSLNPREIDGMAKSPVGARKPIIWGCSDGPYRETGVGGASLHPCGGFSVPLLGLINSPVEHDKKICGGIFRLGTTHHPVRLVCKNSDPSPDQLDHTIAGCLQRRLSDHSEGREIPRVYKSAG